MNISYSLNTPAQAGAVYEATRLNNQGRSLYNQGRYAEAEKLYKRALEIKIRNFGPENHSTAIGHNALGEVYIKLARLDEAEEHLTKAIPIVVHVPLDQASYTESLAKVYEMKNDLARAKEVRLQGSPDKMICAHELCPVFPLRHPLKQCGRCHSIYYCSEACQRRDWARHKPFCRSTN